MDATISNDPFEPDFSFPRKRWESAGATPEELDVLRASFSAADADTKAAELREMAHSSDGDLRDALESARDGGVKANGLKIPGQEVKGIDPLASSELTEEETTETDGGEPETEAETSESGAEDDGETDAPESDAEEVQSDTEGVEEIDESGAEDQREQIIEQLAEEAREHGGSA